MRFFSLVAVACVLALGRVAASADVIVYNDDYGTDAGRVSHSARWDVSGPWAVNLSDNATSFTASAPGGYGQISIPVSKVGDGSATAISQPLTFEITLQASGSFEDYRVLFVNPNVSGNDGVAYTWTITNDGGGTGRFFAGSFGGGNLLVSGIDPFAKHTFVLTIPTPAHWTDASITIDGSAPYTIVANVEQDDSTFVRLVNGSSNTLTVEHAALTYTEVPEPATLALAGLGGLLMLARRRN